jgi:uncharacterized repeat protein (TIGR01451 family)
MYHAGYPGTVVSASGNYPVEALPGPADIETGTWYRVRVTWNAAAKQMQVYFNNTLRLTYNRDLIKDIFGNTNCVYLGFSGADGGATNDQRVRVCVPTPTPTMSPTATPTASPTATRSGTPTLSPTRTATVSVSPTATRTPSFTASPTNGPTTPTITQTPISIPMTKSENVTSASIGDTITYCMTWTNNTGGATAVAIWDTVPITMAYLSCWAASGSLSTCSYSPRVVLFTVGAAIANGASGQVCFNAVVTGYPWSPGFDAPTWLAWLARDRDLDPILPAFRPIGEMP